MRSVVLISPNDKEMKSLQRQWAESLMRQESGANMYVNSVSIFMIAGDVRISLDINGERIYIDDCGTEADPDYVEGELAHIDINTPTFYLICYSDRDTMYYFIENSIFGEGSYMDNDHGRIISVDELRKEEILDFIE